VKTVTLVTSAVLALAPLGAQAATLTFTAPEHNGTSAFPDSELIETWNIALPMGDSIISATFESTFGNSMVSNSAEGFVTVGGVTVATCDGPGNPCWDAMTPTPINYNFAPGEFASLLGAVDLIYEQTECCVPRGGASTLTIETDSSVIPVPAAGVLLASALGIAGFGARRQRS